MNRMTMADTKSVLLVEDESPLRMILAEAIQQAGFKVFTAADGEAGYSLAEKVRPALIITDVIMPRMDGNQLMKKVRASDFGRNIPFIILTARSKMKDYFDTMGVNAFVPKPFKGNELVDTVRRILDLPEHPRPREDAPPVYSDPFRKKRIILMEDDVWVINLFQSVFEEYGYTTRIAHNPAECLEAVFLSHPDVIVVRYPIEGLMMTQLIDLIRSIPYLTTIPIFAYADQSHQAAAIEILKAGAADFLVDLKGIKILKRINERLKDDSQRH